MNVMYILWLRQIKRYMRSKSRVLGAIGQPLLFLLALGYGLGSVFKKAGQGDYLQFLVPGIIAQTILFSAVFWGIQIIWDKQFGFLKETLVAPVPRVKIMIGSALGGATLAAFQGLLVLVISLFLGFRPVNWAMVPLAVLVMILLAVALACFGSGIASIVNDFQGFQAINQFIIFPLYFLSGAIYPLTNIPVPLKVISSLNPLSYAIDLLRFLLISNSHFSPWLDLVVLMVVTIGLIAFGTITFRRIQA
jgi:ABC-2 type transport system permease protein